MDLRQHVPLDGIASTERATVFYDEYLQRGTRAENDGGHAVRGVKGTWVYSNLPYANWYHQAPYDAMHVLSNVAGLVLNLISGSKYSSDNERILAAAQGVHDNWWRERSPQFPWVLSPLQTAMLENRLAAVVIPTGMTNEFAVRNVLTENSSLTS
jgi:hypothetical protein